MAEQQSAKCRKAGCNQSTTLFSVFCEDHHAEQLHRFGAKVRTETEIDRLNKWWNFRQRNVLVDSELIQSFFDESGPDVVNNMFELLPKEFQSLIASYLIGIDPDMMPPHCSIGTGSEEYREKATTKRREAGRVLKSYLKTRDIL